MTRTFSKLVILLALLTAVPFVIAAQDTLVVGSIDKDEISTTAGVTVPPEAAVFDVYRVVDDDGVYRELIDSVYFLSEDPEENEWIFRSVWTGGGRYVEEGDTLVPTTRVFSVDTARLEGVLSPNMPGARSGDSSFDFGGKAGVFASSSAFADGSLIGLSGEVFLNAKTTEIAAAAYFRGMVGRDSLSGFDAGFGFVTPGLTGSGFSAIIGALGGRRSLTVYDTTLQTNVEINTLHAGAYLTLMYIPPETGPFGVDLSLRSYVELDSTTDAGFLLDVNVSAVYSLF
jgi:hypothetical protein